jgi:hypothetical protein
MSANWKTSVFYLSVLGVSVPALKPSGNVKTGTVSPGGEVSVSVYNGPGVALAKLGELAVKRVELGERELSSTN